MFSRPLRIGTIGAREPFIFERLGHIARACRPAREFARLRGDIDHSPPPPSLEVGELELLAGGVVPERLAGHLRAECVRRVILPCADALLGRPSGKADPRVREASA